MNFFNKKNIKVPNVPMANLFREIGNNPFVDWIIVLFVSTVVSILLISVSVYLFKDVNSGNIKDTNNFKKISEKSFSRDDLSSIINQFNKKESISNTTRHSYSGPTDPSN